MELRLTRRNITPGSLKSHRNKWPYLTNTPSLQEMLPHLKSKQNTQQVIKYMTCFTKKKKKEPTNKIIQLFGTSSFGRGWIPMETAIRKEAGREAISFFAFVFRAELLRGAQTEHGVCHNGRGDTGTGGRGLCIPQRRMTQQQRLRAPAQRCTHGIPVLPQPQRPPRCPGSPPGLSGLRTPQPLSSAPSPTGRCHAPNSRIKETQKGPCLTSRGEPGLQRCTPPPGGLYHREEVQSGTRWLIPEVRRTRKGERGSTSGLLGRWRCLR